MSLEQTLKKALKDPTNTLRQLDRLDAEDSLLGFIRLCWPILEPGRQFVEGWAVQAICDHLEAVSRGQITRLLINVPPGCMKSLTTNVFWPAWEWIARPSLRYVSASYAEALTIRDNRRCRNLITSALYQELWGSRFALSLDANAKIRFDNDKTGFKIATSVGGAVVGERGDRFIMDDPNNIKEVESKPKRDATLQFFTEVVPTRVNDADSAIIVIQQRTHQQDVSGHILSADLGYEHLCIPMEYEEDHPHPSRTSLHFQDPRTTDGEPMWPERFPRLEQDKATLSSWGGDYAVAGQFQQRPVPRGGGMFQYDHFGYVDSAPNGKTVRGWDLAATKDGRSAYTVGIKMRLAQGRVYILDVRRLRGSPAEVERAIRAAAEMDGPTIEQDFPQDPGAAGVAVKASIARLLHGYKFRFSRETGSKEDRARPLAAQAEAGNLLLLRSAWNPILVEEFCSFPAGRYKDQMDAASRAYARLIARRETLVGAGPEVIGG